MGREEGIGDDSEGVRREKKQREKKWENLLWEMLNEWKKFFFRSEEDNIYRSYALWERDCFLFFFFFGKTTYRK